MQVPVGFAVGYKRSPTLNAVGQISLIKSDCIARHKTFEFKAVFYTLTKMCHTHITSVYSNFHQWGVISLGKYPIDLVVVEKNGKTQLMNFDGNFCHGCPTCPARSETYAGNKTRDVVEKDTAERDVFIREWIKDLPDFSYKVITDCHHEEYTPWALDHAFSRLPPLQELITGIPTANSVTIAELIFCHPNLTYLAVVSGHIASTAKPLLVRNKESGKWERPTEVKDLLVTRQYLDYMMKKHLFCLTDVNSVYFYKTSPVLSDIYKSMTRLRANRLTSASYRDLLKKVGNFSCGYFGYNAAKRGGRTTWLLVGDRPHNYDLSTCQILPAGNLEGKNYYMFKRFTPAEKRF
jgi:hypothetical protein